MGNSTAPPMSPTNCPLWRSAIRITYRVILPGIVFFGLFVLSTEIPRPVFSDSVLLDALARGMVALILGGNFFILADSGQYDRWFYGRILEPTTPKGDLARMLWVGALCVMLFAFTAVMARWAILTFIPVVEPQALSSAILLGLLTAARLWARPPA